MLVFGKTLLTPRTRQMELWKRTSCKGWSFYLPWSYTIEEERKSQDTHPIGHRTLPPTHEAGHGHHHGGIWFLRKTNRVYNPHLYMGWIIHWFTQTMPPGTKFIQHSDLAHPCLSADTEGKDEHLNGTLTPSEKLTVVYILTWVWLHDFIHNKVCGATHCRSAHVAFLVLPRFSKVLKLRLSQCYLLANIFLKTSYISR